MTPPRATLLLAILLAATPAQAQFGRAWQHSPAIAAVSADAKDSRLAQVDDAIAFWNAMLDEAGSGFRLGKAVRHAQPVPEEGLRELSAAILAARGGRVSVPPSLRGLPGDLTILLSDADFISFTGPFDADGKRVIGIKGAGFYPFTLPNVPVNVIAHEIGHAIGFGHNADPTRLMCGRPAPCRPDIYQSAQPRVFPLTDEEKARLRVMYP